MSDVMGDVVVVIDGVTHVAVLDESCVCINRCSLYNECHKVDVYGCHLCDILAGSFDYRFVRLSDLDIT